MRFPVVALRSIDLVVPDLAQAVAFYTAAWGLMLVDQTESHVLLRATGEDHHVLALHRGAVAIRSVTFRVADAAALDWIAARVPAAGGRVVGPVVDAAGGTGLTIQDPQGRLLRFVLGDQRRTADASSPDRPCRLSHVNVNSRDTDATRAFFEVALGFQMTDRSKMMAFVRCNSDHHAVVIADAPADGLNHVAFMMPTLDAVMRGAGRMVDHAYPIAWGVGRHGPGDNVFAYFVDPFGIVIEYTAEVLQVDETYRPRGPSDWTWPPGRTDQWGIAPPKTGALKRAQRAIGFEAQE